MTTESEIVPNRQKETLYLDSSVPSAYFDERTLWRMTETQEWWHHELPQYEVYISTVVILEINNTRNENRREQLLNLVTHFPQYSLSTEIEQIAQGYLNQKIIPQSSSPDALHIAIASFYKIDFLATWNCKHLAEASVGCVPRTLCLNQDLPDLQDLILQSSLLRFRINSISVWFYPENPENPVNPDSNKKVQLI